MKMNISRVIPGLILFIFLVGIQVIVIGQDINSQKALKSFEKALSYFQAEQWKDCESELYKAIKEDSTLADAYIMLGDVLLETGRPAEAVEKYQKSLDFNPRRKEVVYNLLANTLSSLERYAEACQNYEILLGIPGIDPELRTVIEVKLKNCQTRKALVENPVPFEPVNIGPAVNTVSDEYINAVRADDAGIYFTRRMKNPGNRIKEFTEDFYYAGISGDSLDLAKKLNFPPGKDDDAGAICISPDGRQLFFTACFREDTRGSCDLYFSEKTGSTWTTARNMGAHINSDSWDAQPSISPDGKTLYFASNRKGGTGSSDIWKTDRTAEGGWSIPVNVGIPVNTTAAEMAPFIHFDNQTMYFSSSGHPGMGGADLFKSSRENGYWSQPENLGYPINSTADELVIVVNPEGKKAFISSNTIKGNGGYDIFTFDLYDAARPVPVSYLKGKVYDLATGFPLEASIELIDLILDSTIFDARSDSQNGEFLVCLPYNRSYALNVSCDGYLFYSEHFPLTEIKSSLDPVLKDIPLEPIASGKTMILRNIFYDTDQYDIKPVSYPELDKLVYFMEINPVLRIEIGGHTDDEGTEEYNAELSLRRARAVYEYLNSHGIDTVRLTYKGYGESKPVSTNATEEGSALNRRTEITILNSD